MDPVSLYQPPQIVHANSFNSTLLRERLMSLEMRPIGSGNTTRNITPLAITFGPLEQSAFAPRAFDFPDDDDDLDDSDRDGAAGDNSAGSSKETPKEPATVGD